MCTRSQDVELFGYGMVYLFFVASTSVDRYLAIFLNDTKVYTTFEIGILLSIRPAVNFIFSILWGILGDITNKRLIILGVGIILTIITFSCLLDKNIADNIYLIGIIFAVSMAFRSTNSLLDTAILQRLQNEASKYGNTRSYGAAGAGIGAIILGILMDYGSYMIVVYFGVSSIVSLASILFARCLGGNYNKDNIRNISHERNDILAKNVNNAVLLPQEHQNRIALFSFNSLIFFSNLLIFGICMAFVEEYLFLFIMNKDYGLNAPEFLCGLTIVAMVIGELIIFYFSHNLLNKVGIRGMLFLSHLAYVTRVYGYSVLPHLTNHDANKSYFVLLLEPLHGLTFAAMWTASVEYGRNLSDTRFGGTIQGLITGVYSGLAVFVGAIIGGWLYEYQTPVYMYSISWKIMAFWMVYFQILFWSTKPKRQHT